jgi:hypothetical protein
MTRDNIRSATKIKIVKRMDTTATIIVELSNSSLVGQLTFAISTFTSLKNLVIFDIISFS